ncbi:MAG: ribosome recycling factor [Patescibacteria group bacterium]|mgnify:CR=1 FL=1
MIYDFNLTKAKLKEIEEWLKTEYHSVRTGRATPFLLDRVEVNSYGAKLPLKQVAAVTIEDARTLRITPWDKAQMKEVESAITAENLGLSISGDQTGIRVTFPELTTESRERLIKVVNAKFEEARVSVRQTRDKIWSTVQEAERAGTVAEDDKFRAKDELQKIVDKSNATLEEIRAKKETVISN